jgi:4'-phosphopantetheinyl transferase
MLAPDTFSRRIMAVSWREDQMADLGAVQANEVHVWHGIVDQASDQSCGPSTGDLACLSARERARCLTFARPVGQRRFAAAHAGVRRLLAGYLNAAAPSIRFGRVPCCRCGDTEHGPPRIDWPPTDITFSLSHAGDHWLLAVTRGRRVGVDIELPGADIALLAPACLSAAELDYLEAHDGTRRDAIFYTCWTRKEAVLKACGIGLAAPPSFVRVAPALSPRARVTFACPAGPREWAVDDLARPQDSRQQPPGSRALWFGAIAQPLTSQGRILLRAATEIAGADPGAG